MVLNSKLVDKGVAFLTGNLCQSYNCSKCLSWIPREDIREKHQLLCLGKNLIKRNFPKSPETKEQKFEQKHLVCSRRYADFEGMNGFPICMNEVQEMTQKTSSRNQIAIT